MAAQSVGSFNFAWLHAKPQEVIIGTGIDYYKLFYQLKCKYEQCYLFESLAFPGHQDRYYSLGFDPALTFSAKGDGLRITGRADVLERTTGKKSRKQVTIRGHNPYKFLQNNVPLRRLGKTQQGGLIGYFSYEAVNYFEPALQLTEHPDFDTFQLGLYADGLIYDSLTDVLTYYTYAEDRSAEIRALLPNLEEVVVPDVLESVVKRGQSATKAEHAVAVERTLEEIRAGNSFQCEVGFKTYYDIKGDKIAVYDKLRAINPGPFLYYIKSGDVELLGSSPEILIAAEDGMVLSTPAAGTVKRGGDVRADRLLARQLLTDPKEIAEHHMLVDLHRNDISRVCKVGSVKVKNLMYLVKYSHVQHIVSDIVGELASGKDAYDLLASILPGGVLTGAPKIETIKIIQRNESTPRGPYGGAVGRFSMNGDAMFCMPIRSLFCKGDRCFTQTCSGIVYDSTIEGEYQEVIHKQAAMEQTLRMLRPFEIEEVQYEAAAH